VEEKTTVCGTPNYLAPEAVQTKDPKRFGPMGDIWAIGCILYIMLTGSAPFESSSVASTLNKIKNGTYNMPEYLSSQARDLISKLLAYDP
jgi:carbon catabolite-derepressing protein kinase